MKHFVIKDINSVIAKDFTAFFKEMNDISLLASAAAAPFISFSDAEVTEDGNVNYRVEENDYSAFFKGSSVNGNGTQGRFELSEDGKKIIEISYTVNENAPVDMRVKLNCEGESLIKSELERAFEADFAFDSMEYMKKPLEAIMAEKEATKEIPKEEAPEAEFLNDFSEEPKEYEVADEANFEEFEKSNEAETEEVAEEEVSEYETLKEEFTELPVAITEAIKTPGVLIERLSNLCHDITRGKMTKLNQEAVQEETLDNGAKVTALDQTEEVLHATFRKGTLDDFSEVSFYLEEGANLIFSVYFNAAGNGNVATSGPYAERNLTIVKEFFELA